MKKSWKIVGHLQTVPNLGKYPTQKKEGLAKETGRDNSKKIQGEGTLTPCAPEIPFLIRERPIFKGKEAPEKGTRRLEMREQSSLKMSTIGGLVPYSQKPGREASRGKSSFKKIQRRN